MSDKTQDLRLRIAALRLISKRPDRGVRGRKAPLRHPRMLRCLVVPLAVLGMGALARANAAGTTAPFVPPAVRAARRRGPVVMNGDLDTAVWRSAPALRLTQQNPHPGAPTPFVTTVRILRGRTHLYFGIVCRDPDPGAIAVHTLERDGDQSSDDNVMIVLDPFDRKKLGYVFQVNAGGAMADGLISPGYDNSNSAYPNVDFSWNGYWNAVVKRTPTGWIAEIRISTRSFQFRSRRAVWGLNIARYVPRDQLTLAWSGINLNASVTNLQWEGRLEGMRGLTQGSGFEFTPYVVGEYSSTKPGTASWTGFGMSYDFTPELTGLFTYHTDFSQAQANTLQISASPYPQSIPETRSFFLEGANVFTFGHNLSGTFMPFYSRRIGLVDGEPVPLDEGVKLLGNVGPWTVGVLDTRMGGSALTNPTNLFVGRALYNINDSWRVGTLVTHGDPLGNASNTLASFDTTWSTSTFDGDQNLDLTAWAARSSGSDLPEGTPVGYGFDAAYPNDLWNIDVNYNFFGSALDPALGFIQRPGTKQSNVSLFYQPRPSPKSLFSWVRQFFFGGNWFYATDLDNRVESNDWNLSPIQFTTQSGWQANLQVSIDHEVLASPYAVLPGVTIPAGTYPFVFENLNVSSPSADPLSAGVEVEDGAIYNGRFKAFFPNVSWTAPGGHLATSLLAGSIWLHAPGGHGILRVAELNLSYSFTPSLTLSTLTQYDNISRSTSENAILQWNIRSDRTFYLVWNHGLTLNPNLLQGQQVITGNTVVVKLVWGIH